MSADLIFALVMMGAGAFVQLFFAYFSRWVGKRPEIVNGQHSQSSQILELYERFQMHARVSWICIAVGALLSLQELFL